MDGDFLNTNYKSMTNILLQISFIFCGFNGRLVAKNPHETKTFKFTIKCDQYMRYVSFWFDGILGLSIQ
jgi:hypothetical protein